MTALLACSGVSKRFGGVQALTDVSLELPAGRIVGLIGPNGAGKSTLFNCLSGVTEPDSGSVCFAGHDLVARTTPADLRRRRWLAWALIATTLLAWGPGLAVAIQALLHGALDQGFFDLEVQAGLAVLVALRLAGHRALGHGAGWAWSMHCFLAGLDLLLAPLLVLALLAGPATVPLSLAAAGTGVPAWPVLAPASVAIASLAVVSLTWLLGQSGRAALSIHAPVDRVTRLGLGRTFQNIRLFQQLSVLDNARIGAHHRAQHGLASSLLRLPGHARGEADIDRLAATALARVGLADRATETAGSLPYGLQRRLEIARALAAGPRALLLDEPAAGMNPSETEDLAGLFRSLRDDGLGLVVIEHDMRLIMELCDEVVVLDQGRVISRGSPQTVRDDPKVIAAYLGGG